MITKVRGVTYASVRQAAQSLGVTEAAVYSALWRGKMELLGLGNTKRKKYVRKVISTDSPTGMKRFRAAAVAYKQNMGGKK